MNEWTSPSSPPAEGQEVTVRTHAGNTLDAVFLGGRFCIDLKGKRRNITLAVIAEKWRTR